MKRITLSFLVVCSLLSVLLTIPLEVHADMGPKPAVHIEFENLKDEPVVGTLLAKEKSTGPYSYEHYAKPEQFDTDIWRALMDYDDIDGYHFLQIAWDLHEDEGIHWTYYPPKEYKILLYYPQSGTYIISESFERVYFDTYYVVDMEEGLDSIELSQMSGYRRINGGNYFLAGVALRLMLTLLIESVIAYMFIITSNKQMGVILRVNVLTQIALNVILFIFNNVQHDLYIMIYGCMEFVIVIFEALIYTKYLKQLEKTPKSKISYLIYALVANIVSFASGFLF